MNAVPARREWNLELGAPLPVVFGVSGHKDIAIGDLAKLEESLRQKFLQLSTDAGEGYSGHQLLLLTALADGADRFAAKAANACGIPFIAVLPMPRDLYVQEFTASSRAEFESLLELAAHVVTLPLPDGADPAQLGLQDPGDECSAQRNARYVALGAFLASSCDILIALWDGEPYDAGLPGGTAHVVHMMLERSGCLSRGAYRERPIEPSEPGLVWHLHVSRSGNVKNPKAGTWEVHAIKDAPLLEPHMTPDRLAGAMAEELRQTRRLAPTAATVNLLRTPELMTTVRESTRYLLPDRDAEGLSPAILRLRHHQAQADALARTWQGEMKWYLASMLALGIIAALAGTLYSEVPYPGDHWFLYLGVFSWCIILGYILLVWKRGRVGGRKLRDDPERDYEDFRALAEGLRAQFFWALSGVQDCTADHYLAKQRSGLGWVRIFLRLEHLLLLSESRNTQHLALVRKCWVNDQAYWYEEKHQRAESVVSVIKAIAGVLFVAGLFCGGYLVYEWYTAGEETLWGWRFGMAFLPISAGLLRFYLEVSGKESLVVQYSRMSLVFHRAKRQIEEAESGRTPPDFHGLFFELGREALAENGDWLLMNREKEIRMPN